MKKHKIWGIIITIAIFIFITSGCGIGGLSGKKDISFSDIVNSKQPTAMIDTYKANYNSSSSSIDPTQEVNGIMVFQKGTVKFYGFGSNRPELKDLDNKSNEELINYAKTESKKRFNSEKALEIKTEKMYTKRKRYIQRYEGKHYTEPIAQKVTIYAHKGGNTNTLDSESFTVNEPWVDTASNKFPSQYIFKTAVSNIKSPNNKYGGFATYSSQLLFKYDKNKEKTFHFDNPKTKGIKVSSNWD
ncbi:hypothetical protein [Companilactobacillus mishanensis]|uniref:Lipoprotein n=1 Tax=Companilactobacillus mishanensis TaxID=2486008 RepID=A0ABW9P5S3_9LACO|nr:hypothetical protein [Companilactobacillus mishanensis]MQS44616.1 hypothetical protein [Companilactobacillus mishanensis]